MTTTSGPDLTPFGFTPTESLAYAALVERGPSSGYAVARALSIARANAYQALDGLVAKGAAQLVERAPRIVRAVAPAALLAVLAQRQAAALDRLEAALAAQDTRGAPTLVEFTGERELQQLVLRTAARQREPVEFLAPAGLLTLTLPVWRKRAADEAPTSLWSVGDAPERFPLPVAGSIAADEVTALLGAPGVLLVAADGGLIGSVSPTGPQGLWTSIPVLVGVARAALAGLTRS